MFLDRMDHAENHKNWRSECEHANMAARAPLNQIGQIAFRSGKGVLKTNALLLSKTEIHAEFVKRSDNM